MKRDKMPDKSGILNNIYYVTRSQTQHLVVYSNKV